MKAPDRPCLKCGTVHWSRLPCPGTKAVGKSEIERRYSADEIRPVVRCQRCVELEVEVRALKRELAKRATENATATINAAIVVARKRGRPKTGKAMSSTERSRKRRAKVTQHEFRS